MRHTLAATLCALALATPTAADVTLKQITEGRGLGMSGKAPGTTYIKGNKMRTDVVDGNRTRSTIFDLDTQKMTSFDSRGREADVWDMAALSKEIGKSVDTSSIQASITPNGQTKPVGGQTAAGYDAQISMAAAMAGSSDMNVTVTMQGPVWIVKGAPGTADYAAFYRKAAETGFVFTDPRAARGQPGQARAMTEMYRQFAELGGIAFESSMQIKMNGSGPLAGILSRMGNITMTTIVESVETGPLADDLFAPPATYKLNERR